MHEGNHGEAEDVRVAPRKYMEGATGMFPRGEKSKRGKEGVNRKRVTKKREETMKKRNGMRRKRMKCVRRDGKEKWKDR